MYFLSSLGCCSRRGPFCCSDIHFHFQMYRHSNTSLQAAQHCTRVRPTSNDVLQHCTKMHQNPPYFEPVLCFKNNVTCHIHHINSTYSYFYVCNNGLFVYRTERLRDVKTNSSSDQKLIQTAAEYLLCVSQMCISLIYVFAHPRFAVSSGSVF